MSENKDKFDMYIEAILTDLKEMHSTAKDQRKRILELSEEMEELKKLRTADKTETETETKGIKKRIPMVLADNTEYLRPSHALKPVRIYVDPEDEETLKKYTENEGEIFFSFYTEEEWAEELSERIAK
jgi:hypothetical protein